MQAEQRQGPRAARAAGQPLEQKHSKDEILERYLNTAYFGDGAYGIQAAGLAPWRPRIRHSRRDVEPGAAQAAAADFLTALGIDIDDESAVETPRRMAHAYAEMLTVPDFDMTTFSNDEGYDELVLVENIPVQSLCEHHMLPFVGVAHVGYLPGDRILGLSKFARLVDFYARRAQTQERLTRPRPATTSTRGGHLIRAVCFRGWCGVTER